MKNEKVVKKRGRKSKKEIALLKSQQNCDGSLVPKKIPKKRGRKPKGGKIVKNLINETLLVEKPKQNIILHLKCSSSELLNNNKFLSDLSYDPQLEQVQPYNSNDNNMNLLNYSCETTKNEAKIVCKKQQPQQHDDESVHKKTTQDNKVIWDKLNELKFNLHDNNVSDKKSNCFWCTCGFENPPVYIPRHEINNNYEVYGCFCTPECATAYLCNENIDNSTRWERYSLLNSIYGTIFNYTKNIKPAPQPFYLLNKYYGNISIDEYRKLLENDKLLLVVEKPLTRILPELHEENNEYNINNGLVQTRAPKKTRYRLSRNKKTNTPKDTHMFQ